MPAMKRLRVGCDTSVQNWPCSHLNVCIVVLFTRSQTLTVLYSPQLIMNSCFGWKEMSSAQIDFPHFCFTHPPDLDRPVICSRYDQGKSGVESQIVSPVIMSLENIFNHGKCIEGLECPCPHRPNRSPWTRE